MEREKMFVLILVMLSVLGLVFTKEMLVSRKTKLSEGRKFIPRVERWLLGFVALAVAAIATSCATAIPKASYTFPQAGNIHDAPLAVKDYQPLGVIFVQSTEIIDGNGRRSGSKITYEMLMREAIKLGADDVINIKIDVNEIQEFIPSMTSGGSNILRITYKYTANALAIKYTDAVQGGVSGVRNGTSLAESPPIQEPPQKFDDRFSLDDKRVFAVSVAGAYGYGWTAGGTVTVFEKYKPGALFTPSFFITAKYFANNDDHDSGSYWHPHLFAGGAGVLLKYRLRANERFIFNIGASLEYIGGTVSHYNESSSHYFDYGSHTHVMDFSSPGIGIQYGVSYRLTRNIALNLNGVGKYAFMSLECEDGYGHSNFGMGGAELGVTYILPY
ncbi:MAG: hypothetical protein LBI03_10985 [Clostridiales bacterium]|jgi:hypothetical protein|nr:hypothetical protein [Clostridiales bacterium]